MGELAHNFKSREKRQYRDDVPLNGKPYNNPAEGVHFFVRGIGETHYHVPLRIEV
jgi:hypothetical protein